MTLSLNTTPVLRLLIVAEVKSNSVQVLTESQLQILYWVSRYIGMVNPGKQALLSRVEVSFDSSTQNLISFEPVKILEKMDERFNLLQVTGEGPGASKFEIHAFKRIPPSDFDFAKIKALVGESQIFKGQNILITGVGPKNLGGALAYGLGLNGAHLLLNAHHDSPDLKILKNQLIRACASFEFFYGDASLKKTYFPNVTDHPIHQLVLNAFPPIISESIVDQSADQQASNILITLNMVQVPLAFKKELSSCSRIIHFSSIYTLNPKRNFLNYGRAKIEVDHYLKKDSLINPEREYLSLKIAPLGNRESIASPRNVMNIEEATKQIINVMKRPAQTGYHENTIEFK